MDDSWLWSSLIFAGLLVLSSFFSGSETALIGCEKIRLSHLAEKGSRGARRALHLIRDPGELLGIILVGNNLVNVMAAAVATVLLGPVYATLVVTLLLLIFAEVTPKTLAAHQPERFAIRVAGPILVFGWIFKPIVWLATGLADILLWPILRGKQSKDTHMSRQELMTALSLGAREGELEPAETRMAREVLALKDKPVARIMIPLLSVDGISEGATYDELMREFARSENTRYPVFRNQLSEMIGTLVVKDLILHQEGVRENWRKYVRPLMRCRSNLEVDELLRDMQIQRSHLAAVEDDEGRVVGIVTMDDVLEEIVGEIQDEHDEEEGDLIREVSPGRYLVQGSMEVDDLCKVINADLGRSDQNMHLSQWFEKQSRLQSSQGRRIKFGNVRVIQRSGQRFEILVKGQIKNSGKTG